MSAIKNFNPYAIVKNSLSLLRKNEVIVISGRFGIGEPRKTLSAIGKDLNLSRERIRQIEKEAMKRLASKISEQQSEHIKSIISAFESLGGITSHEKIDKKFLEPALHEDRNQFNSLNLILCLIPQIKKIDKTKELEASWILSSLKKDEVVGVINSWVKHLENVKKPLTIDVLVKENPNHSKYEITFLSELPYVSKKLVKTETGYIGLATWPEVNPKNVRDKIYYILKSEGTPLHFDIIAKKINGQNFSKKNVVRATVHNELIADNRFVLVGRGIYALAEWGYKPGTVQEIIRDVLMQNKSMNVKDIIREVSKQRAVKKNTILINLQTKPEFLKVRKDEYALK